MVGERERQDFFVKFFFDYCNVWFLNKILEGKNDFKRCLSFLLFVLDFLV